ncbi:hypothetical protein KY290_008770 [Solanum tuberosum]|uniref:Uncharacterized protein n=1 Tax=Solanum tuberosum TaxID=4113 RepID=A0ABQ7WBE8_SOLTU|nr:hypothetical protein KY290_008770 [Solanum tuberosum]
MARKCVVISIIVVLCLILVVLPIVVRFRLIKKRGKPLLKSARPPSILAALPPDQQANATTFVPLRKSNLKVNNGGTNMPESLNHSPAHAPSVSATPPPYQQANGTTFVPPRKSNLKVNNGGTDMPYL